MEGKILNIIPESLRKDLIKEVLSLVEENPGLIEDIRDKKDIYEDIKKWAEQRKNQNQNG